MQKMHFRWMRLRRFSWPAKTMFSADWFVICLLMRWIRFSLCFIRRLCAMMAVPISILKSSNLLCSQRRSVYAFLMTPNLQPPLLQNRCTWWTARTSTICLNAWKTTEHPKIRLCGITSIAAIILLNILCRSTLPLRGLKRWAMIMKLSTKHGSTELPTWHWQHITPSIATTPSLRSAICKTVSRIVVSVWTSALHRRSPGDFRNWWSVMVCYSSAHWKSGQHRLLHMLRLKNSWTASPWMTTLNLLAKWLHASATRAWSSRLPVGWICTKRC